MPTQKQSVVGKVRHLQGLPRAWDLGKGRGRHLSMQVIRPTYPIQVRWKGGAIFTAARITPENISQI